MSQEDRETQNPAAQWNAIIVGKNMKLLKESQRGGWEKDSLKYILQSQDYNFWSFSNLHVENWIRCSNYIPINSIIISSSLLSLCWIVQAADLFL